MSNSISIEFDNHAGYFTPGLIVTGNVIVFLSAPKKSRNITLHVFGNAKTAFVTETSEKCSLEKKFFDYSFILWKALNNDEEIVPAGKHCFKFSFEIPKNCLPNFEGKFGHVRYGIVAKMHISLQFNLIKEQSFFVLSTLSAPIESSKPVKRSFLSRGISIEVMMPKEDYSCDENVPILIAIKNGSKSSIETIETGIKTRICYKGTKKLQNGQSYQLMDYENAFSLSLIKNLFSLPGDSDNYKRNLQITGLYPTQTDDIIDVKHFLYVKLLTKKVLSSTLTEIVPITLYSAQNHGIQIMQSDESATVKNNLNPSSSNLHLSSSDNVLKNIFGAPPPAYNEIDNAQLFSNVPISSTPSVKNEEKIFDEKF